MTRKPVVVIGAGLAGLSCARLLLKHNVDVEVLESQNDIGGRVRTDGVDGFLLDRGFQVLQTAYPEAASQLDYDALQLHAFEPGALIRSLGRTVEMSDPWRRPGKLFSTAFNGIGNFSDRLKLAKLRWHVTHSSVDDLWNEPESTTQDYLRSTCGLSSDMVDRFFRPWFSGVFLEKDLATSSRFFRYLFRIFALGEASLPRDGMGAIPKQLACEFPGSAIRLSTPVESLEANRVRLRSGENIDCRAIVLAVEGPEATRLTNGLIQSPEARATTCIYYGASQAPFEESLLVLNGDMSGPINNLCVVSNIAKSYAPEGQSLISVSVVGTLNLTAGELEHAVRRQLREWYGAQVDEWSHLRSYFIPFALPAQPPRFGARVCVSPRLSDGLFHCGDYCQSSSIQGAMVSGRKAAEAVIAGLSGQL